MLKFLPVVCVWHTFCSLSKYLLIAIIKSFRKTKFGKFQNSESTWSDEAGLLVIRKHQQLVRRTVLRFREFNFSKKKSSEMCQMSTGKISLMALSFSQLFSLRRPTSIRALKQKYTENIKCTFFEPRSYRNMLVDTNKTGWKTFRERF
jgi:hypothetical protein